MNVTESLQQQFQVFILDPTQDVEAKVREGPRAAVKDRLAIYARAYRSRLVEVLDADYPALHLLAGDEGFSEIAHAYIEAHPSQHPNARWFGRHMPAFLSSDARYAASPVLAEMAEFEWAMSLAFDAADEPVMTLSDLAALPPDDWPGLRLRLHPSLQMCELKWNVPPFWRADQQAAEPPVLVESKLAVPWVVWRRELTTYYRFVEPDEAVLLRAVAEGATFAQLCDRLQRWHDSEAVPLRAMELLKRWIGEGLVARQSGG